MKRIEIHAEVTNKCMLNCMHCSSVANTNEQEMDLKLLFEFVQKMSKDNSIRLILTGGEPLLRCDLEKLLEWIKGLDRDIEVGLFTTGLIEEKNKVDSVSIERIKALTGLGLKFVFVSVYSDKKKLHDYITQSELSWNKMIQAIKSFVGEGVETNVNIPIMKINSDDLGEIIHYLKGIGINEIRFLKLINHGAAIDNWKKIGLTEQKQKIAIENIWEHLDEKITLGGFLEFKSCQYLTKENKCLAGEHKLYIDNSGNVYPCGAVKHNDKTKLGNICNELELSDFRNQGDACLVCDT